MSIITKSLNFKGSVIKSCVVTLSGGRLFLLAGEVGDTFTPLSRLPKRLGFSCKKKNSSNQIFTILGRLPMMSEHFLSLASLTIRLRQGSYAAMHRCGTTLT